MAIELKGRLDHEALEKIFTILKDEQDACSFLISDGFSEKIFYFTMGGIRLVSLGGRRGVPIGEMFIANGRLTEKERDEILEYAGTTGQKFGEAGVGMGKITGDEVNSAVQLQVEAELCDLFLWGEADYEFRDGQPPSQFYDERYRACSLSCEVYEVLENVSQRKQRLQSVLATITSDRVVVSRTHDRPSSPLDPTSQRVYELVDGNRRIRDIIQETDFTSLIVHECLSVLLENRLVRKTGGESLDALGRAEVLDEIRRLEAARSEMMGDVIVRTRLARAYMQISENAKAGKLYKEIAAIHRRNSDLRQALQSLGDAIKCQPNDFSSREQMIEIYRSLGEKGKILEEGRVLAEILFKNNLLNRARNLLGNLVNLAPGDPRIRRLYALTLLGLGEKDIALWQLRELAKILEQKGTKGHSGELKEVYRRILALDKSDKAVRRRLLTLAGRRNAVWISRAVIAGAVLLLVVAGGSFVYELNARNDFKAKGIDLDRLLLDGDYDGARVRVRDLQRDYGHSTVGRRAQEFLNRIDEYEASYLNRGMYADLKKAERAERAGNVRRAAEIYRRIARIDPDKHERVRYARQKASAYETAEEDAQALIRKGQAYADNDDFEKALRIYTEVTEIHGRTDAVRKIKYPVNIRTVPRGARVYHNGELVENMPLFYSLHSKSRIRVQREGFEEFVLDITEVLESSETIYLQKSARWVFEGDGPFQATPVIKDGVLYVPGRDRYLYAISTADGSLSYRVPLGIFGDSGAAVATIGDMVLVGTARGDVVVVETGYGRVKSRIKVGGAVVADIQTDPTNPIAYVTESGGRIVTVDPTAGRVLRNSNVMASPTSSAVTDLDFIYVSSYDRRLLMALNRADGSEAWKVMALTPVSGSPAVYGGCVLFGADDKAVHVVDILKQEEVARLPATAMVKASPVTDAGRVFFGSIDGAFYSYKFSRTSSQMLWRTMLPSPIFGSAAAHGGRVYVGCISGELFCLDAASGEVLWVFKTGGKIVSTPLIRDRTVYVTSMDGKIYAIRE